MNFFITIVLIADNQACQILGSCVFFLQRLFKDNVYAERIDSPEELHIRALALITPQILRIVHLQTVNRVGQCITQVQGVISNHCFKYKILYILKNKYLFAFILLKYTVITSFLAVKSLGKLFGNEISAVVAHGKRKRS